jgi:hypothetical protein
MHNIFLTADDNTNPLLCTHTLNTVRPMQWHIFGTAMAMIHYTPSPDLNHRQHLIIPHHTMPHSRTAVNTQRLSKGFLGYIQTVDLLNNGSNTTPREQGDHKQARRNKAAGNTTHRLASSK